MSLVDQLRGSSVTGTGGGRRAMRLSWGVSHEAVRGGEGPDRYEQEHTVGKELREGAGAESSPKKPGGTGCTAGSWCKPGSGEGQRLLRCVGTGRGIS